MEPRCLEYEATIVNLSGTIKRVTFPGSPNYESIEKSDRPETYWILVLERPACVSADPKEPMNVAEARVVEVQLILRDYAKFEHLLGSRVMAKGKLMHKFTGHHHTLVLVQAIEVRKIRDRHI